MRGALGHLRVLDFTQAYSGAFCTLLLRDLGAEVIKIEKPVVGDVIRTQPPVTAAQEGSNFLALNRGKKGITLDLGTERGRSVCMDLVKRVDVVVENFSPGVMDRLGLDYQALSSVNPRLIYASTSGFGQTGPRAAEPAYDIIAQAAGGVTCVEGYPDDPPHGSAIAIGDLLGGAYTAMAVMAALQYRSATGEGQRIDISMQDAVWAFVGIQQGVHYFATGEIPKRYGSGIATIVPFGTFPAKDGHVAISVLTRDQWESLVKVMGREDLIGAEDYASVEARVNHRAKVDAVVSEWSRTVDRDSIVHMLRAVRVPCTPIPTFPEVVSDPQLLSRGMVVEVEHPRSGRLKGPGSVFKLSKSPGDVAFPAPLLGQHNDEVYRGLLGYSKRHVERLRADGVV